MYVQLSRTMVWQQWHGLEQIMLVQKNLTTGVYNGVQLPVQQDEHYRFQDSRHLYCMTKVSER